VRHSPRLLAAVMSSCVCVCVCVWGGVQAGQLHTARALRARGTCAVAGALRTPLRAHACAGCSCGQAVLQGAQAKQPCVPRRAAGAR
jgi:hypothetical protein